MTYLLQVSGIWIVLFALYFFGLRGLTFFNHNRIYLLGSLILGLLVPALAPLIEIAKPEQITFLAAYDVIDISNVNHQKNYDWTDILLTMVKYLYWAGVLFMLSRLAIGLYSIYKMYVQGEKTIKHDLEFVYNEKPHLPFSFLNKIFLSKSISFSDQINHIIHHEITHVQQKHTWDVLFIELTHVFFWFNPILVFYKKAMKDAHEFIADNAVVSDQNKTSYINLLFNATESDLELGLVNSFFNSQLLNRIKMMDTPRSQKKHLMKYLIIVPCLAVFTYLLASTKTTKEIALPERLMEMLDSLPTNAKQEIIEEKIADEVPKFKEGEAALFRYLGINIKYPSSAREEGKEGKTIVAFTVNLDGKIEDAKIIKGVSEAVNKEALRVVNEMNDKTQGWIPAKKDGKNVKTEFTLPIVFRLESGAREEVKQEVVSNQPLFIIDGIELERTTDMANIDNIINPNDIQSVNVLKDVSAVAKYGDKGKNGVILIQTKNAKGIIKNKPLEEMVIVGYGKAKQNNEGKAEEIKLTLGPDNKVYDFVAEKPVFPGGDEALFEYLGYNIKYPEEARKNKIEGRVIVKFVVMKDGSIAEATVVRGIGSSCDEEALRVMKNMPKWKPGKNNGDPVNVTYTLPISFRLENSSSKNGTSIGEIKLNTGNKATKNHDDLIYFIDNEEVDLTNVNNLDPNTIERMDVIKDATALKAYKHKGKNGVIKITTKSPHTEDKVFDFVAEKPEFQGGANALFEYLGKSISYPEEARKNKVEGRVIIKFVVRKDGSISDAKIVRGIGGGCDEEALRVVENMPSWNPGKNNGKAVNVTYTLPLSFKLEGTEDKKNTQSKVKLPTESDWEFAARGGIELKTNLGIVLKENPATNGKLIFNVNTTDLTSELNINVVDISGMTLGKSVVKNVKTSNLVEMNISNQFNGLLIINVKQGVNITNTKLAVQR
jgi:TonB family protein